MADVEITPIAAASYDRLPRTIQERILKILTRLTNWPDVSGAKPLSGDLAGWYRIRTGDYRIRFFVEGDIVTVDKIGHRKDVYED